MCKKFTFLFLFFFELLQAFLMFSLVDLQLIYLLAVFGDTLIKVLGFFLNECLKLPEQDCQLGDMPVQSYDRSHHYDKRSEKT